MWAATPASYCPSRAGELPKQNMTKSHERWNGKLCTTASFQRSQFPTLHLFSSCPDEILFPIGWHLPLLQVHRRFVARALLPSSIAILPCCRYATVTVTVGRRGQEDGDRHLSRKGYHTFVSGGGGGGKKGLFVVRSVHPALPQSCMVKSNRAVGCAQYVVSSKNR